MGKRQQKYQDGFNRFCHFLEIFLKDNILPSESDIRGEYQAIESLRPLTLTIDQPTELFEASEPFFFLLCEEYERYDNIFPSGLILTILPLSMDSQKEINRFLTS